MTKVVLRKDTKADHVVLNGTMCITVDFEVSVSDTGTIEMSYSGPFENVCACALEESARGMLAARNQDVYHALLFVAGHLAAKIRTCESTLMSKSGYSNG
jgi:hypothetical protein